MNILIKPIVTEKMTAQGEDFNRYGFVVAKDANKLQIKKAVEELYDVKVAEVNTMRYAGKAQAALHQKRCHQLEKLLLTRRQWLPWPKVK